MRAETGSVIDHAALLSFETFAVMYPLYSETIYSTFHIVRDIIVKQEVEQIVVCDGNANGFRGYMVSCVTKASRRKRVLIPWAADADVELLWLSNFIVEAMESNTEVYICIYTPESVIYELVETELC